MSLAARELLCSRLVFQADSQRTDLMNESVTNTAVVALLLGLTGKGWKLEITAVKSDHHDDSGLGRYCHYNGYAVDLWPISNAPGSYVDANDVKFAQFLAACRVSPWIYQVGLAGSADTQPNREAAGYSVFSDDGDDHIHLGAA